MVFADMNRKHIGILAGVVGIISLVVQYGFSIALENWSEGGFGGALPMIGTAGQTLATYNLLLDIVGPTVTLLLAVSLGYYIAQRVDIVQEYRHLVEAVAIGSAAGVTLAGAPILAGISSTTGDVFTLFLLAASLASMLVSVALLITVGALAGAALAYFRAVGKTPSRPTEADTSSLTNSQSELTDDNSQSRTQPTR